MTIQKNEFLICGAGIAGVAAAYYLATRHNCANILLVDPEPPLSVTSDKSVEAYRNFWPGPGNEMVALANRSIDLLEDLHREEPALLHMNRRGYLFASADPSRADEIITMAAESCDLGAGRLRLHGHSGSGAGSITSTGSAYIPSTAHSLFDAPDGIDVILNRSLIRKHYPYLAQDTAILMHTRRCGWFAARQFGMHMLEKAKERGVQILRGEVIRVTVEGGAVVGAVVKTPDGEVSIRTNTFVNAAGPGQKKVAAMLGVDLPVHHELHTKVAIDDQKGLIPRDMPLIVWYDPITLEWTDEERSLLAADESAGWLLDQQPAVVACRPEGEGDSQIVLMQWEVRNQPPEPIFPIPMDPEFPEYVLRGLARMFPKMGEYFDKLPKPYVDGGYYIAAPENRPIIGPLGDIKGAYIIGALSGAGMQLSAAAGELLASHVAGCDLPQYAPAFLLQRFDDPAYLKQLEEWGATGSL